MGRFLEEAYDLFGSQSMGFTYAARTRWPVRVTVRDLAEGDCGHFCSSIWGENFAFLEFQTHSLGESSKLRRIAGHEFFHLVQFLYDPRDWRVKATVFPNHH